MSQSKERIYMKQWLYLKPYDNQAATDNYYLKLSNEVKQSIMMNRQSFVLKTFLNNSEIDILSCFLTSYLEDLVSKTNIWNSFIGIHKRLYGKELPFYATDDYFEQEINLPDVCFLTWYFLNTARQDKFTAPFNDFIIEISEKVMDVFEGAWEYAPENTLLKTFYTIDETEEDFYTARSLIDNVLFKTYLFYPDTLLDLLESEFEIMEEGKYDEQMLNILNDNRDQKLHHSFTRLLGLKGHEWVANILGERHNLSKDFRNISKKISGYFFYKGQDEENIFIEHIASGKRFNLTKKSFDFVDKLNEIDTILYMGIVKWRNEWWFSGVYFQAEFNPDLVLNEKNSMESRKAVSFLDHQREDTAQVLERHLKAFKAVNNNQQIAFMDSDKIESFLKDYMESFNNSLELSQKEKDEAKQRVREDGFFGNENGNGNENKNENENENEKVDFSEIPESGLVFFNPEGGVEIAFAVNSAFPGKNNPFYNEDQSEEHILRLFHAEELSADLVRFCVDNFKQELTFFKSQEGNLYLEHLDFLLRFWKRGYYFPKPTITFIGKEDERNYQE